MAGAVEDVYPTLGIVQLELKRNLNLMSVKQLKDKLRQNGCRFPSKAGKEQLVNICVEILSTEHSPLDCDPDDLATDEEFDEIDIETEIRGIEQGHITAGTRSSYSKYQKRMYEWWASKTDVEMCRNGDQIVGFARLQDITVRHFEKFVYTCCQKIGVDNRTLLHPKTKKPMLIAFESIANFRKALFNIFTEKKERPSSEFCDGIKLFFKGLKRKDAQEKQEGYRKSTEGKAAMPFCVYAALQQEFFKTKKFFELAYTSLTWHLMCRADNTAHITLKHLSATGDCLCVEFSVSKMDKGGEALHQFRSCFANPQYWHLDVIFCLACYLCTVPELVRSESASVKLFPGEDDSQKQRYTFSLGETLRTPTILSYLESHGLKPSDFGAHSLRKGCATYVTSGSTGGPSIVAVCQRAGWTMGNVLDRYLKFDLSGDAFVGRVAAGLPLNGVEFGHLPPHFIKPLEPSVVAQYFPQAGHCPSFAGVAQMCLASLIHHFQKIQEISECAGKRFMFRSAIYSELTTSTRRDEWFTNLTFGEVEDCRRLGSSMIGSGIPPHIGTIRDVLLLISKVQDLPSRMMLNFGQMLDERGMSAPHVTPDMLKTSMAQLRRDIYSDMKVMFGAENEIEKSLGCSMSPEGYRLYFWSKGKDKDRKGRIIPENFTMPACSVYDAGRMWWMPYGNVNCELDVLFPPLRLCDHFHLPLKQQPRWCEWNSLMRDAVSHVTGSLHEKMINMPRCGQLTLAEVDATFRQVVIFFDRWRKPNERQGRGQISTLLRKRAVEKAFLKRPRNETLPW
jgi:hypothetical protein